MLRNMNATLGGRRILGVPDVGIIASQIIADTATGDDGAGLLYDSAQLNSGKLMRLRVVTMPTAGVVSIDENGAILVDFTGVPDAVYTLTYNEYADNVLFGVDTATFTVGAGQVTGGSISVKVNGAYVPSTAIYVKVAGTYRLATSVFCKQAGTYTVL